MLTDAAARRQRRIHILLAVSVALGLAWYYYVELVVSNIDGHMVFHHEMMNGESYAPFQYRILGPLIMDPFVNLLDNYVKPTTAHVIPYIGMTILCFVAMFVGFYLYFCEFFKPDLSLIGTLFIAGMFTVTFKHTTFSPWSPIEAAIFPYALILIHRQNYMWLIPLVLLGSLNRETTIFIPFVMFCTLLDIKALRSGKGFGFDRRQFMFMALLTAIWAACFIGLRMYWPDAVRKETLGDVFAHNTQTRNMIFTLINTFMLLGVMWWYSMKGIQFAPTFVARSMRIVPVFLLLVGVFGIWYEVRMYLPLYPILVSAGLAYMQHASSDKPEAETTS